MTEKTSPKDKSSLLQLSKAGDVDAFGELVRLNQAWLRGWLRGQLRDWTAADDLAQETFVTAFKKIKEFRGDGSFETWLRGIAHNHFRNYIRKRREEYIGGSEDLQALLINDENSYRQGSENALNSLNALRECLAQVKKSAKKILEDRYTHGKSVQEIARQEKTEYSAMTMKLHRLRKSLAHCVEAKLSIPKS